jgi:hypothetical protein
MGIRRGISYERNANIRENSEYPEVEGKAVIKLLLALQFRVVGLLVEFKKTGLKGLWGVLHEGNRSHFMRIGR